MANASTEVGDKAVSEVTLQAKAGAETRVVNFGTSRDFKAAQFEVAASAPVDRGLLERINLVVDPIVRVGDENAETVEVAAPTFSKPRLTGDHKTITFRVCLDPPGNLQAGRYTGLIAGEGPEGVQSATVTVVANAKDGRLFWWGMVVVTVLAVLALSYKDDAKRRADAIAAATGDDKANQKPWRQHAKVPDPSWWVGTLAALFAMCVALVTAYSKDPSWGQAGLVSLSTLIAAGLAAIGIKEIFPPKTES